MKANIVFLFICWSTKIGQTAAEGGVMLYAKHQSCLPMRSWKMRYTGPQSTIWMLISLSTNLCRSWLGRRPPSFPKTSWPRVSGSTVKWKPTKMWGKNYIYLISSRGNFFSQKMLEPTRSTNVVDIIFSTDDDLVCKVVMGEFLTESDHHIVWRTVDTNLGLEILRPWYWWNLRWADYDNFVVNCLSCLAL